MSLSKMVLFQRKVQAQELYKNAKRVRKHKSVTRVLNEACFRIVYDDASKKYTVREFVKE